LYSQGVPRAEEGKMDSHANTSLAIAAEAVLTARGFTLQEARYGIAMHKTDAAVTRTAVKQLVEHSASAIELMRDAGSVGTTAYAGRAYFWHREYRHTLREATVSQRRLIHAAFIAEGVDTPCASASQSGEGHTPSVRRPVRRGQTGRRRWTRRRRSGQGGAVGGHCRRLWLLRQTRTCSRRYRPYGAPWV
jgi:hypothetical protein